MTKETIMALSGRELDAAVAETIAGFVRRSHSHKTTNRYLLVRSDHARRYLPPDFEATPIQDFAFFVPFYSTDANACHLMEAEIEQRELVSAYVYCLAGLVLNVKLLPRHLWVWDNAEVFAAMAAPLDQKCRAALLSMLETKEADNAQ